MDAQLSLFGGTQPLDDVRSQLARLHAETRVWLDVMLERGATMEFLDDRAAEDSRLMRAATAGLTWLWVERWRGVRRAWQRPSRAPEPPQWQSVHVHYEPRMERELGATGRQSEQRFYWPSKLG